MRKTLQRRKNRKVLLPKMMTIERDKDDEDHEDEPEHEKRRRRKL
jgi:hypothetical protein